MQNLLQVRMEQLDFIGKGLSTVHFVGRFVACSYRIPANAEVAANVLFDTL